MRDIERKQGINKPSCNQNLHRKIIFLSAGISLFSCVSIIGATRENSHTETSRHQSNLHCVNHVCRKRVIKKVTQSDFDKQLAALKQSGDQLIADEKAKMAQEGKKPSQAVVTGRGMPSVSLASPNAFGSGNSIFAAVGYFSHWNGTTAPDGNFTAGGSFGDAHKYVGVTLSWLADSIGWDDSFNKNGGLGIRVNRYLAKNTAIAGGVATPVAWGSLRRMSKSYYVAVTQGINTRFPITLNIGAGTGAFYSAASMQAGRDDQVRMFGGVGVTVLKGLSLITDYATKQLNAGATYVYSFKKTSLFLTAAGMNIAKQGGFQPHAQVIGGFSYAFS